MIEDWRLITFRLITDDENTISVKPEALERSGYETIGYYDLGEQHIVIVHPHTVNMNEVVEVIEYISEINKALLLLSHARHKQVLTEAISGRLGLTVSRNAQENILAGVQTTANEYIRACSSEELTENQVQLQDLYEFAKVRPRVRTKPKRGVKMAPKVVVVSVETDDMVAGVFDLSGSGENRNIELDEESIHTLQDPAKFGDLAEYTQRINSFIDDYLLQRSLTPSDVDSLVIVHPGEVDVTNGIIIDAGRFELQNVNLRQILHDNLGVEKVHVFHDGPSLTLGEMTYGVGKEHSVDSVFFCIVGAGVGGAIHIKGEHHLGASLTAGDIGHTIVNPDGSRCPVCRRRGCLETYTSRYWINDDILQRFGENPNRSSNESRLSRRLPHINDPWRITTRMLAQAIKDEDVYATEAVRKAAEWLGYGIAIVVDFLNPDLIILGGDLMDSIEEYYAWSVDNAKRIAYFEAVNSTIFERAKLGRTAALWGGVLQAQRI